MRQRDRLYSKYSNEFQSTHPHGVRHKLNNKNQPRDVSIHAPTWGATVIRYHPLLSYIRFNPRTHMGCDWKSTRCQCGRKVSIHAPTWGATEMIHPNKQLSKFQSTHPHGVRHLSELNTKQPPCFNPRTHMGCDSLCKQLPLHVFVFQSTHPHGVRR